MAAELIGQARCWNPRCGSDKARVTLAKSGLPVMTCNRCNSQLFARSDLSDDGIRALLVTPAGNDQADETPAAAPTPSPAPAPAGAPAAPAAAPATRPMRWGVLGDWGA